MLAVSQRTFPHGFEADPGNSKFLHEGSLKNDSVISIAAFYSKSARSHDSDESATEFARRTSHLAHEQHGPPPLFHHQVPRLVKTPWEADRSRRSALPKQTKHGRGRHTTARTLPEHIFRNMPYGVFQCVLEQLENVYFSDADGTCVACYMRDLYNLTLTSRNWYRNATPQLYRKIVLAAAGTPNARDLPWHSIKLLRRTLRNRPELASLVRELHFPDAQIVYQESQTKYRTAIINTLASLVMAAPKLELFSGLYLMYDHCFDRLTHALSTRTQLREKTWVLRRSDVGMDEDGVLWSNHDEYGQADNSDAFLKAHANWTRLETLCLFGQTTGRMDYRAFAMTFRSLPSLKHLLISDFDRPQFNDRTLLSLPAGLRSLRLQDLPGVTERGLSRFFSKPAATRFLRNLSLIALEITSAQLIASVFANSALLQRFTLSQNASPAFPTHSIIQPESSPEDKQLYRSQSLHYIHWDTISYGPCVTDLANSITSHALPALRTLRVPSDDNGILQRLCRPTPDFCSPSPSPRSGPADTAPSWSPSENPFAHATVAQALQAALRRREERALSPLLSIVVTDVDGLVAHTHTLRAFMGELDSRIGYELEPSVPGSPDFLAGLDDLLLVRQSPAGTAPADCATGERAASSERQDSFDSGYDAGLSVAFGAVKGLARERDREGRGHRTRRIFMGPRLSVFF